MSLQPLEAMEASVHGLATEHPFTQQLCVPFRPDVFSNILHYESVPWNIAPGSQTDTFRLGLENLHISITPVLEALVAAVVL